LLPGNWSMTSDSNASTLFNLLRAFFAFIRTFLRLPILPLRWRP
jgi:hypothetical protein